MLVDGWALTSVDKCQMDRHRKPQHYKAPMNSTTMADNNATSKATALHKQKKNLLLLLAYLLSPQLLPLLLFCCSHMVLLFSTQ